MSKKCLNRSEMSRVLKALDIANKRIDQLEKYNLDLANESHNKSLAIDRANERIAELESPRKRNLELIKALFYAPSSPVTPNKAKEIEDWFIKVEQLRKEQDDV